MCKWNIHKMQSESNEFSKNSWRIDAALERHFAERAKEVWARNWMNPEIQAMLFNKYPPTLIAKIRKTT